MTIHFKIIFNSNLEKNILINETCIMGYREDRPYYCMLLYIFQYLQYLYRGIIRYF